MTLLEYISEQKNRVIYPQMGAIGLPLTDYTIYEVYEDPYKQLEISLLLEERMPLDFTYPVDYGVVFTETLGVPLLRPAYDFPSSAGHPIHDRSALKKLRQPRPEIDGLMPSYLEAIRLIANGIPKPEMVALVGPCTLAGELAGIENLFRSMIRFPDFVAELLDFCTESIINFLLAAVKNGAGIIQISEPTAGLISPESFARLITPRLRSIFAAAERAGAWRVLHICGETTLYLSEMACCGAEALSLDQVMDMPAAARSVPENIILAGNIDPYETIFLGSPRQIQAATRQLLSAMAPYPNFMPSPGCDCLIGTSEDNLRAFINTV